MNIESTKAPKPVGSYPHSKKVGNLLFLSGVGPRKGNKIDIPGVEIDEAGNIIDYDFETKYFKISMFEDNSVKMKVIK